MASAMAERFKRGVLRWVARALVALWAIYWIYFIFTSGAGIVSLIYMVLVLAIVGLTWRTELIGGILLILQVIFAWSALGAFGFSDETLNQLLMIVPPLLVGVLLILSWFLQRLPVVQTRPAKPRAEPE